MSGDGRAPMPDLATTPDPGCPCYGLRADDEACCCGDAERHLRAWADGAVNRPAMTPNQRAWCQVAILACGDSTYQGDYSGSSDKALAGAVLRAWLDYARDKGLA